MGNTSNMKKDSSYIQAQPATWIRMAVRVTAVVLCILHMNTHRDTHAAVSQFKEVTRALWLCNLLDMSITSALSPRCTKLQYNPAAP